MAILPLYVQVIKVTSICPEGGINQPTFYQWQWKYSGKVKTELERLKEFEQELDPFKRIVADLTMESRVLKDVIAKSALTRSETGVGGLCPV